jgi:hypothetical protein
MSFMNFVPNGTSPSGKTKRWAIQTLGGTHLAYVSWYAPWRKYTVQVGTEIFDSGWLREIADFLDKENQDKKGRHE